MHVSLVFISVSGATFIILISLYLQAALIMQVLSLTDQQIALLPEDQRQSIMVLKEQIAHGTPH